MYRMYTRLGTLVALPFEFCRLEVPEQALGEISLGLGLVIEDKPSVICAVLELQPGAAGFQQSNPPVLQCMLLKASLNVFSQTSMAELTAKSRILTGYLELLIETFLSEKARASENG